MLYIESLGKQALEHLTHYLNTPEPWKRDCACRLLDVLVLHPEAESALIDQLHRDPDADVRALIVFQLGRRSSPRAHAAIVRARADRSMKVRWVARSRSY
jgi:hypothetical protein